MITPDIVLYGHPMCGDCQSLKAWLDKRAIAYEERHIADFDGDCLRDGLLLWAVSAYCVGHIPARVEEHGTPMLISRRLREVIFDAREVREVCA